MPACVPWAQKSLWGAPALFSPLPIPWSLAESLALAWTAQGGCLAPLEQHWASPGANFFHIHLNASTGAQLLTHSVCSLGPRAVPLGMGAVLGHVPVGGGILLPAALGAPVELVEVLPGQN